MNVTRNPDERPIRLSNIGLFGFSVDLTVDEAGRFRDELSGVLEAFPVIEPSTSCQMCGSPFINGSGPDGIFHGVDCCFRCLPAVK